MPTTPQLPKDVREQFLKSIEEDTQKERFNSVLEFLFDSSRGQKQIFLEGVADFWAKSINEALHTQRQEILEEVEKELLEGNPGEVVEHKCWINWVRTNDITRRLSLEEYENYDGDDKHEYTKHFEKGINTTKYIQEKLDLIKKKGECE